MSTPWRRNKNNDCFQLQIYLEQDSRRGHFQESISTSYQGAKNSTIQSSLLSVTNSSKLLGLSSTEALGSDFFSADPPPVFVPLVLPSKRSFNRAFIYSAKNNYMNNLVKVIIVHYNCNNHDICYILQALKILP